VKLKTATTSARAPRAFTLIEAVVVVIIIGVIASIILVALNGAMKRARDAAERQEIRSLTTAVEQFKAEFGFLPPLINDATGPIVGGQLAIRPDKFLSGDTTPNEPRFSVYTLPYFVMGMGDAPGAGGRPIDGAAGPRMTRPNPDGTFNVGGKVYEPSSAMGSKDSTRIVRDMADQSQLVAVDRWGRGSSFTGATPPANALRYYRWLPKYLPAAANQLAAVNQYMVPRAVGDPNKNEALRNAGFAIVSVGPNGVTDEKRPLPRTGSSDGSCDPTPIDVESTKDDIVEVGG
jgi:prepilin-type N-terminal cleavage/methylation domain-containing protein